MESATKQRLQSQFRASRQRIELPNRVKLRFDAMIGEAGTPALLDHSLWTAMLNPAGGMKVWLCSRPIDLRMGFNGLAAQVKQTLRSDPFSGHLFVFRGKRSDYLKLLYWGGTGLCYSPDREAERASALAGCRGYLHADGYSGINGLYGPDPITGETRFMEVACWAHSRRKLVEAHIATKSPAAKELLEAIAKLFAIEAEIRSEARTNRMLFARTTRCLSSHV